MALNLKESQLIKGIIASGGSFGKSANALKALKKTRVIGDLTVLEKGDEFPMPANAEALEEVIGNQKINGTSYPFVGIVVKRGSKELAGQLFPGALSRRITQYAETDEGIERGEVVEASGEAVELYKAQPTQWDGLVALCGKTIVVENVEDIPTLRFGTNDQLRTQKVYTFGVKK